MKNIALYISKHKIGVLFDVVFIAVFAAAEVTKENYFCLVFVAAFTMIFTRVREYFSKSKVAHLEDHIKEMDSGYLQNIESLVSEINYPTLTLEQKRGLIDEFTIMKTRIMGANQ